MWKQIAFEDLFGELERPERHYGFGRFDDKGILTEVVCGCCGRILEPYEVKLIQVYNFWVNLEDEIYGDGEP